MDNFLGLAVMIRGWSGVGVRGSVRKWLQRPLPYGIVLYLLISTLPSADAKFNGADLSNATVESVDFEGADLTDAVLVGVQVYLMSDHPLMALLPGYLEVVVQSTPALGDYKHILCMIPCSGFYFHAACMSQTCIADAPMPHVCPKAASLSLSRKLCA